jgi:hypothetical protein
MLNSRSKVWVVDIFNYSFDDRPLGKVSIEHLDEDAVRKKNPSVTLIYHLGDISGEVLTTEKITLLSSGYNVSFAGNVLNLAMPETGYKDGIIWHDSDTYTPLFQENNLHVVYVPEKATSSYTVEYRLGSLTGDKIFSDYIVTGIDVGTFCEVEAPEIGGYRLKVNQPKFSFRKMIRPQTIVFIYEENSPVVNSSKEDDSVHSAFSELSPAHVLAAQTNAPEVRVRYILTDGTPIALDKMVPYKEDENTITVSPRDDIFGFQSTDRTKRSVKRSDSIQEIVFTYVKNPDLWKKVTFDSVGAGVQTFEIPTTYSVASYNRLPSGLYYQPILPIEPTISGWEFEGWHLESGLLYDPEHAIGGETYKARYKATATVFFGLHPDYKGKGTLNAKTGLIAVTKEAIRISEDDVPIFHLEASDVPIPEAKKGSVFRGWIGHNVTTTGYTETFRNYDLNLVAFEISNETLSKLEVKLTTFFRGTFLGGYMDNNTLFPMIGLGIGLFVLIITATIEAMQNMKRDGKQEALISERIDYIETVPRTRELFEDPNVDASESTSFPLSKTSESWLTPSPLPKDKKDHYDVDIPNEDKKERYY